MKIRHIRNQKGFTLIEGLLIVIAITLIALTGYYIWQNKQSGNEQTQQTPAAKTVKTSQTDKKWYFTLNEWNLRALYEGDITVEYKIKTDPSGVQYAYFSSQQLDDSAPDCKSDGTYGGVISRYSPTDHIQYGNGEDSGMTADEFLSTNKNIPKSNYNKVGGYFYYYTQPNGVCGNASQASQEAMDRTKQAVLKILSKFEVQP
jgi:competence protein ComGC